MDDNDSSWKRWQVRVGVVAGLLSILSFLLTWSKSVRDLTGEVFSKKPVSSVALPPGKQDVNVEPRGLSTKSPEGPRLAPKEDPSTEATRESLAEASSSPVDAFMKKYVAEGQPYRTGTWTVVISAANDNNFPELHAAAESALSEKGYAVRPLFRAALLQDTAANDELYTGNPALLKRIGAYRDGLLVGKLRSEISQNASLDIFTAHLFADLRVISAPSAKVEGQLAIDETGAGFSEAAATTAAEHRLADKLKQRLLQSIPSK
jgi:hypothetical protein